MRHLINCVFISLGLCILFALLAPAAIKDENFFPHFGRDTVLVWKIQISDFETRFIVRIAEFSPNRHFEWEDDKAQGTVFIPEKDVLAAKGYVNTSLFEAGVDTTSKNYTTLWLSRKIYKEFKEKKNVKFNLDGVRAKFLSLGEDQLIVEVNRAKIALPVIKISDDRGSERWFLDHEDNPLLVKHKIRTYTQTLTSITTDKPNSLRWIRVAKRKNHTR